MLRIYPVILEVLQQLRAALAQIERRDSDLGRQLRRSATSHRSMRRSSGS